MKKYLFWHIFSNLIVCFTTIMWKSATQWLAYEYRKLTYLFLEILIFRQIRQYATKSACMQVHFYTVPKYVFLWTILISTSFQFPVPFFTRGLQSSCAKSICELCSKKEGPLSDKNAFNPRVCGGFKVKWENCFIASPFQWFKIKKINKKAVVDLQEQYSFTVNNRDFHDLFCSI